MPTRGRFACLAAALVAFSAWTASAQEVSSASKTSKPDFSRSEMAKPGAPDFGVAGYEVVSLTAYDFEALRLVGAVTGVNDDENGFSWATGGSNPLFIGSFQIPAGAVIDYVGLRYCDTDAASAFIGVLYDIFASGAFTFISNTEYPDQACGTAYNPTALGYPWNGNAGHSLDLYIFQSGPAVAGEVKFRGAEVHFKRTVSPAPGVATFTDVPTDHIFFRYVEALAAAGITGGCGVGLYCPNNPVTRGQMAAFLSIALGLHFPN